jgi:hypothetical protein
MRCYPSERWTRKDLVLLPSVECLAVRAGMARSALQKWRGNKHSRQHSKTLKHIIRNSMALGAVS